MLIRNSGILSVFMHTLRSITVAKPEQKEDAKLIRIPAVFPGS
jgi:hypothetical protein